MIRETARASRDEVVAAASTVMRPDQKRGLLSPCDAAISLERRANEISSFAHSFQTEVALGARWFVL